MQSSILNLLCKEDEKWQRYALSICKNTDHAKDLVNQMYLSIYNANKTIDQISNAYVFKVLKSIHIKNVKKTNVSLDHLITLGLDLEDDQNDTLLQQRQKMHQAIEELDERDQYVLYETSEQSYRKCASEINAKFNLNEKKEKFSYNWFFKRREEALERLKETETIKKMTG